MNSLQDEANSYVHSYDIALFSEWAWRGGVGDPPPLLARLVRELLSRNLTVSWRADSVPRTDDDAVRCVEGIARGALVLVFIEPDTLAAAFPQMGASFGFAARSIGPARVIVVQRARSSLFQGFPHYLLSAEGVAGEIEAFAQELQERLGRLTGNVALSSGPAPRSTPDRWRLSRGRSRDEEANAERKRAHYEFVTFSTFAPASISPGSVFILDLWAYLAEQAGLVDGYARELGRERKLGMKAGVQLVRDTVLEATLALPGFKISEPFEPLVWTGEPANCSFQVEVPAQMAPGVYHGVVRLSVCAIPIARVSFEVRLQTQADPRHPVPCNRGTVTPLSAFACYSSEDRDEVLGRVQGMRKIAPGLDIFLDVLALRSGDHWERTICAHIDSKDVFYLFWSLTAARSKEVEKEWRYAFDARGIDYIDPVPLVDPRDAPPPLELKSLHFSDQFLAHIEVQRRINQTKSKRPWWEFWKT